LIHVGARLPEKSAHCGIGELWAIHPLMFQQTLIYFDSIEDPKELEAEILADCKSNTVGTIFLFAHFMPLILQGSRKKVIYISSGMGDIDFVAKNDVQVSAPYAIGKSAANMVVAKFSADYAKQGVLFMSISPGVVDTGHFDPAKCKFHLRDQERNGGVLTGAPVSEKEMATLMEFNAKCQRYAPHWKGPITTEESVKAMIPVYESASVAHGDGGSFVSHRGTKMWL
jgi:NAD(P)-dependent dehydrogenase (short-subunit alcohol dehydrogenase family)